LARRGFRGRAPSGEVDIDNLDASSMLAVST
jgi:hypothetical protein